MAMNNKPSVDQIKTWLSGMTREAAVDFLANMAVQHAPVMEAVQERIQSDPTFTKLFVRSLDWSTTDESLAKLFSQYGEVLEAVVLKDALTGKSKGFGFVTFASPQAAQLALAERKKNLDGRDITCHLAAEKNHRPSSRAFGSSAPGFSAWTSSPAGAGATADRKLFVRGLAWETTTETLKATFEQYGPVLEAAVISDKMTGRSKGFGFVTFQTPEGARIALAQPDKYIDGRLVSCNYASERPGGGPGPMAGQGGAVGMGALGGGLPQFAPGGADLQQQLHELQQQQLQLTQRLVSQQQQIQQQQLGQGQQPYGGQQAQMQPY